MWIQEAVLDDLEQKGSVYLDKSVIITMDEALAVAVSDTHTKFVDGADLFNHIINSA